MADRIDVTRPSVVVPWARWVDLQLPLHDLISGDRAEDSFAIKISEYTDYAYCACNSVLSHVLLRSFTIVPVRRGFVICLWMRPLKCLNACTESITRFETPPTSRRTARLCRKLPIVVVGTLDGFLRGYWPVRCGPKDRTIVPAQTHVASDHAQEKRHRRSLQASNGKP